MYQLKVDVDKLKRCESGCELTFRALALRRTTLYVKYEFDAQVRVTAP